MGQIRRIVVQHIWICQLSIPKEPFLIGRAFFPKYPFLAVRIFSRHHGHLEDKIIMCFDYWLNRYTDYDSRPKVWATVLDILRDLHIPPDIIEAIAADISTIYFL